MTGTLKVDSGSLRVQRDDGFKVHFYQGQYPMEIQFKSGKAYLSITRKDIKTDVIVNIPNGSSIPDNGEIKIEGTKSGQTFDIGGQISTDIQNSQNVSELESCTYVRQVWVCRYQGHHQYCSWEDELAQGYRSVDYYYQTKNVQLSLELDSNNGGNAQFDGRSSGRQKIYTYQGQCH